MKKSIKGLYVVAVICFFVSGIMFYKGYDKMTNYYNPDSYLLDSVNVYVGGDAYNYIINGTYSTSFFTLASGFMISGFLCIIGGMLIKVINLKEVVISPTTESAQEDQMYEDESLPPL